MEKDKRYSKPPTPPESDSRVSFKKAAEKPVRDGMWVTRLNDELVALLGKDRRMGIEEKIEQDKRRKTLLQNPPSRR